MKEEFKKKSSITQYLSVCNEIRDLEKTYHLFDPKFDERSENRWIPEEFNESAHNIFEFRKEVFSTQSIWHDCELNKTISQDIWSLWDEKGGQDGDHSRDRKTGGDLGGDGFPCDEPDAVCER